MLRHSVRNSRSTDLGLRPGEASLQGARLDQECPSNLFGTQTRDGPKRQGNGVTWLEIWVTAGEDETEPLVGEVVVDRWIGPERIGSGDGDLLLLCPSGGAAQTVDRSVPCGDPYPGAWISWLAADWPGSVGLAVRRNYNSAALPFDTGHG